MRAAAAPNPHQQFSAVLPVCSGQVFTLQMANAFLGSCVMFRMYTSTDLHLERTHVSKCRRRRNHCILKVFWSEIRISSNIAYMSAQLVTMSSVRWPVTGVWCQDQVAGYLSHVTQTVTLLSRGVTLCHTTLTTVCCAERFLNTYNFTRKGKKVIVYALSDV